MLLLMGCSKESIFIRETSQNQASTIENKSGIMQQVYLIGDVGEEVSMSAKTLQVLKRQLDQSDEKKTSVVFLGDNIYPSGLHKKDHPLREEDERRINAQLDIVKGFKGEIVFIPGNHDWHEGKKKGFAYNRRQEKYIQNYLDDKVYRPNKGCPDPDEIEVSDELTLIIIDTQWWLHQYEKGRGYADDCEFSTKDEYLAAFKELLKKNREKHVVVMGHHPMYSNGRHGGYFTFTDHLFPLSNINPKLKIPLPVLGSIYPFFRSNFGHIQDISNPFYHDMKEKLTQAMNQYNNVIYAAGHEHNLQYFFVGRTHHIVSGAGSKVSNLRFNKKLDFGAEHKGFAKLEIYNDGETYLNYYSTEGDNEEAALIFRKKLYQKTIREFEETAIQKTSYKGMFKTVVPDSTFKASKLKRQFFGDLNRDLWTQSIKVPYLDIHYAFGGLKPVGKGGGMQTISLKLVNPEGRKYKVRGIKKSADFLVERDLRGTVAQDIVYDGLSGSHPYASVAVPKMSEAAQIYYTKPQLVYIPKDPILGDYLEEFGGMFAIMELHADDDMSDKDNFGNSDEVVNYSTALKKLHEKQDHIVDVGFAIRSRLFDILLGDWDRHDDQWRWATFKKDGKTLYRPIPRDRDQVFFQFDGLVMNISNRRWLMRKFQPFREEIRDIAGLAFNARYFDRSFLVEADINIWLEQAKKLQELMTDEALEAGLRDLPPEAYKINGEQLLTTLKARREKLHEFAERYYKILAKEVNITGTIEADYFEIIRLEGGDVEVNIYPKKKENKVENARFYHRVFKKKETKEIRLYGLADKDSYHIKGESKKSILLRIVAGEDKDEIKDVSSVNGICKKTKVYEVEGKGDINASKETKIAIRSKEDAYFYDRKAFQYDKLVPMPSIGRNINDGFFIGPGFSYTKQGFEKKPYKYKHQFSVDYMFGAEGYNVNYENNYVELLGKYDAGFYGIVNAPQIYDYFGEGNETDPTEAERQDANVVLNNYQMGIKFARSSDDLSRRITGSIETQIVDLDDSPFGEIAFLRENQEFLTLSLGYSYHNLDNKVHPSRGINFITSFSNTQSISNDEVEFFQLKTELAVYRSINAFRKQTTLAFRAGFKGNFGDYNFYQANFLGGINELRGLARNRFAGKSVAYGNMELRKSLLKVKSYVAPFDFGLLIHGDIGRVWVSDDTSDQWHNAVGGGVFLSILNYFAIVGTYSVSDDDELFLVGTGFFF